MSTNHTRRAGWARRVALALVVSVLLAGCTSPPEPPAASLPASTVEPPPPITTVLPADTRGVALPVAEGLPPAPPGAAVLGGDAVVGGVVTGPGGPVPGATVRLERLVGEESDRLEVGTNADGWWEVRGVHGGRYRVRAWRVPDHAQSGSSVLFVPGNAATTIDLDVERHEGLEVRVALNPSQTTLGRPLTVGALLVAPEVGTDGVLRAGGVPGVEATLALDARYVLDGPATRLTASDGSVTWQIVCASTAGGGGSGIQAAGATFPIALPDCAPEPTTTSSTTATLPPPPASFPLGETFRPPFAGPLPAGTYTVIASPGGNCSTTYTPWTSTGWSDTRRTATGTPLLLTAPARDLEASGGLAPCSYTRTA